VGGKQAASPCFSSLLLMPMTDHTTDQWKQSPLLQAVRDFLAARETSASRPLYCALSGGADSVAMACALRLLGLSFTAVHVNFHLRGEESERDERFVRDFCRQHDIPLRVRHFDTFNEAHTAGESLEMAARRLRYAWFSELDGPIFVAHHAEDQAETLLLRLLRGSGLRGLAAMRAVRADGIWRPWLKVRKAEILAFLDALGQAFVTDSSNADTQFRRNFVRHRVLPVLHTLNPRSVATLSETTERLQAALSVYEVGLAALDAECWLENGGEHAVIALDAVRRRGAAGREWLRERLSQRGITAGVAGADANADTPRYTTQNGTATTTDNYSNSSATREWLYNVLKEQKEIAPGVLEDASVAIVINTDDNSIPESDLINLVADAAGIKRDEAADKITILRSLNKTAVQQTTEEKKPAEEPKTLLNQFPLWALIGAAVSAFLLILILLILILRGRKKKKLKKLAQEEMENAAALSIEQPTDEITPVEEVDEDELTAEGKMAHGMKLKKSIGEFTDQNPQVVAKLIQSWMREEEQNLGRKQHRSTRKTS